MIDRIEVLMRRWRRFFSRGEWIARTLRMSKSRGTQCEPGLVMIQVDGLSFYQLNHALAEGRMPFMSRLLDKEWYDLNRHYSGIPSSTPAVQGELFYGVKGCVPAFKFIHSKSGKCCVMYEPEGADDIERELKAKGRPLIEHGSAYSDIFSGGASESHFCASTLGWSGFLKAMNPIRLSVSILFNLHVIVRAALLLVIEFVIAVVDCVRGTFAGKTFLQELHFIITRVGICILLRELVSIGAQVDIARGLPVVHANFIGYDEQSHRRGPSSKFAHWSLQGIDHAVSSVWHAARRAHGRDYDVWIYSDHGQEEAVPYQKQHKRTVESAIQDIFEKFGIAREVQKEDARGVQFQRAKFLGRPWHRLFPKKKAAKNGGPEKKLIVTAMGPLGHVYSPEKLEGERREAIARALVDEAKIPLVLFADEDRRAVAVNARGRFVLPEQGADVLGANHRYLKEASEDLAALCRHEHAGGLIISGWNTEGKLTSFPDEHGSHGGPGPEETNGFALLPVDTVLPERPYSHVRPLDLRHAAERFLKRTPAAAVRLQENAPRTIRIMTYNVHSCIGMDGKVSPNRIARVIARHDPDIVALQELDVMRSRTGGIHQAEAIAAKLNMMFHFQPSIHLEEEQYGDAVLSRLPMRLVRAAKLCSLPNRLDLEPRGALWVAVRAAAGVELQLINTHLSLWPSECLMQAEELVGRDWAARAIDSGPVVLCGDLNASPQSPVAARILKTFRDAQLELEHRRPRNTFVGRNPVLRIDHVFVSPGIRVAHVEVPATEIEKVASDHLPLIVDIQIEEIPAETARRVEEMDPRAAAAPAENA